MLFYGAHHGIMSICCYYWLVLLAGRALGAIISKFKCLKNVGFNTFSKMYQAIVVPIVDYSSSVWGYVNYDFCVKVQYRTIRYFLGVNPKHHYWV